MGGPVPIVIPGRLRYFGGMGLKDIQRLLFLFGIFFGLVFLSGCGPNLDDYYPLKVGNLWEFNTVYPGDPEGRVRRDSDQINRRVEQTYFFNNGEILVRLKGTAIINRNGMRLLRFPIAAGTKWADRNVFCEITAKDTTVKVPAGQFRETVTVVWRSTRRAPVTMSAQQFSDGPLPPKATDLPPPEAREEDDQEYPLRQFVATTVYAKGVGPVKYVLQAAEMGEPLRTILESELVSYELR